MMEATHLNDPSELNVTPGTLDEWQGSCASASRVTLSIRRSEPLVPALFRTQSSHLD